MQRKTPENTEPRTLFPGGSRSRPLTSASRIASGMLAVMASVWAESTHTASPSVATFRRAATVPSAACAAVT